MKRTINIIFILAAFAGWGHICHAQQIQFISENIQFELDSNSFNVSGAYLFENKSDKPQTALLFFPLPRHKYYGQSSQISIFDSTSGTNISPLVKNNYGFKFPVTIAPGKSKTISIKYRQELLGNQAEYILTTTQTWGESLQYGKYKLTTPARLKVNYFSYPPDNAEEMGITNIYTWTKTNFMPDKNFIFMFFSE